MRTNFEISHSMLIEKEGNEAHLSFKFEVKPGEYKTIKIKMDEWQLRDLAKEIVAYQQKIEQECISRLTRLRTGLNYSNPTPKITY